MLIEHKYTRDLIIDIDPADPSVGYQKIPVPPDDINHWAVFDNRSDKRTGWRRIYNG